MITLPKNWFKLELYKKLRQLVRGPISRTRRRMAMVKMRLPRGIFEDMMSNMKEQDTEGLSWIDGVVQPTKKTSSADQFNFVVMRPMAVDRLFSLETADLRGVCT